MNTPENIHNERDEDFNRRILAAKKAMESKGIEGAIAVFPPKTIRSGGRFLSGSTFDMSHLKTENQQDA